MTDWRPCPESECGLDAEVVDMWIWRDSEGVSIAHYATECVAKHRFFGIRDH